MQIIPMLRPSSSGTLGGRACPDFPAQMDRKRGSTPAPGGQLRPQLDEASSTRLRADRVGRTAGRTASPHRGLVSAPGVPIPPPLEELSVIHGLYPRTATTALHYLLAQEPISFPEGDWEISDPVPPVGCLLRRRTSEAETRSGPGTVEISQVGLPLSTSRNWTDPATTMPLLGLDFHNQENWIATPNLIPDGGEDSSMNRLHASHRTRLRCSSRAARYLWVVKVPLPQVSP